MHRRRRDSVAFTVVVGLLVLLGGLAMAVVIGLSGAPGSLALAALFAAVPVGPLVGCFMWLDRYEPEPRGLLAAGLLWGAFVATAAALVFQVLGVAGGATEQESLAVVAPVTEEATKGAFLLLLLWWRRHELDGVLDGIVYAGMVGIGFAFTENVLYLAAAYQGLDGAGPGGLGGLSALFVVRCVFSPFAHPLFTTFTGLGVGLAVSSRRRTVQVLAPPAGYLLAVLAHGLWNGSTVLGAEGFIGVYLVLMVPAFVAVVSLASWARGRERRMLLAALGDAAERGLLPATDLVWVVDLRARRAARRHARRHGGPAALRATRTYQQAAIELGFLHHRLLHGTAPPDWQARGQAHVARIRTVRSAVAFPGQVVPTR